MHTIHTIPGKHVHGCWYEKASRVPELMHWLILHNGLKKYNGKSVLGKRCSNLANYFTFQI